MADPAFIGGTWVLPNIDDTSNAQVRMHVSVSVGTPGDVSSGDISVQLFADGQSLTQLEGPEPGTTLPTVETRAITAFAQYLFDNPGQLAPTRATVTLRGESADFDLSFPNV